MSCIFHDMLSLTWHVSAGFFGHGVYRGCIKSNSFWKKEQGIKVCQGKLNKGYSGGIPLKTPVQNLGSDQSWKWRWEKNIYSTGNKSVCVKPSVDNHPNAQSSASIIFSYALHYCNKNFIAVDFEEKQTIQLTLDS